MSPSIECLENQYFFLRTNLPAWTKSAGSQAQLDQLRSAVAKSRDNYWLATRSILHDDDPAVVNLVSQMNFEQQQLEAAVASLQGIAQVLQTITDALQIGTKLAGLAVVI